MCWDVVIPALDLGEALSVRHVGRAIPALDLGVPREKIQRSACEIDHDLLRRTLYCLSHTRWSSV